MLNENIAYKSLNETEIKTKKSNSSLSRKFVLYETKQQPDNTDSKTAYTSETPQLDNRKVTSYLEERIIEEAVLAQQIKRDELVARLTKRMINSLKYFADENDDLSSAERLMLEIDAKYSTRILGEVLQNIYIQCNDYPNMLVGICKGIARFELEEVMPWGPTMLVGLLVHKNETVKEYAVSVVENWADVTLLPVLKNLDCASEWLKEYIQDVVNYLEECYVLHKKII